MNKWVVIALMSACITSFSSTGFSDESLESQTLDVERLANAMRDMSAKDASEILDLRDALEAMTDALIEENPKLNGRRDLISGGFDEHLPGAVLNGNLVELESQISTAAGAVALGVVRWGGKKCDHAGTSLDDQIRWIAGFEGANYMSSGLNWDMVTLSQDTSNLVAVGEVVLGTLLLSTYLSNRAQGKNQSANINSAATRFCSPLTALAGIGMGGYRLFSEGSNVTSVKRFAEDVLAAGKEKLGM